MNLTLPAKEKLNLISNLATMLGSGIPILEAAESLHEQAKGPQKKILAAVLDDLQQGLPLSITFEKFPRAFDPVTVNLIRAAEEGGNLEVVLKDLAKNIKKDIEFTGKIKSALSYPFLIFLLFLGIIVVILTYVIPRIAKVFSKLKVTVPTPTKILILTSDFFLTYTWHIIAVCILLIIIGLLLVRFRRREIVNLVTSLPLISKLALAIDLARFTNSLGLLMSSGVPIIKAMEYSEEVVTKSATRDALIEAKEIVNSGRPLAVGFGASPKVFPQLMIRVVEAGEKSGALENSMEELAEQFENDVENTLKTLTTLLEPLMLVVIGLMVGGIMLAIIAPIYQMIGNITAR